MRSYNGDRKFPPTGVLCPGCQRLLRWGHTIIPRKGDQPTSRRDRAFVFCPYCELDYGPGTREFEAAQPAATPKEKP